MDNEELKQVVRDYIIELVECDAADSLHEALGEYYDDNEVPEIDFRRALGLWGNARITIDWTI